MRGLPAQTLAVASIFVLAACITACREDPRYSPTTVSPLATASGLPSSPDSTGTTGMSDRGQIRAVYLAYATRYQDGERMPLTRRRKFLAQWMSEPALSDYVNGMERQAASGERSHGRDQPHIMSIVVKGPKGTVDDCLDETNVSIVNKAGKVIRRGKKNIWTVTNLKRTPAGWRVTQVDTRDKSCSVA